MLEIKIGEAENAARIIVVGVGGTDNNAVGRTIDENIAGIESISINTDRQALQFCKVPTAMQAGEKLTKGLGAGAKPETDEKTAEENSKEPVQAIKSADMAFVTYDMGDGTGTGAAPVVTKIARGMDIPTVGVVAKPFRFEVKTRMTDAVAGIERLKESVDTLIVVPNDKLLGTVDHRITIPDALKKTDEVPQQAIQGIMGLINIPGPTNLDFADIQAAMVDKDIAHIGIGHVKNDEKAIEAVKQTVFSSLLETTIEDASHVIINISGDIGLVEVNEAASCIQELAGSDASIIFGTIYDEAAQGEASITVVAAGLDSHRGTTPVSKAMTGFNNLGRSTAPVKETAATAPHAPRYTQSQGGYTQPQGGYVQPHTPVCTAPTPTPAPDPNQGVYRLAQKDIQINIPDFLESKR